MSEFYCGYDSMNQKLVAFWADRQVWDYQRHEANIKKVRPAEIGLAPVQIPFASGYAR